jgi:hypothetical protein
MHMTAAPARTPLYAAPHRAPPMQLPANPGHAAAMVAALALNGTDSIEVSSAIEAMAWRVGKLLEDSEHVFQELAAHAVTLSALSQRWSVAALQTKSPDHAQKFNRMATGCHTAYVRTLIAIEGLKEQRKGRGRVSLTDDTDHDDDDDDAH